MNNIVKMVKKLYNLYRKGGVEQNMELKTYNAQISIFLSDGIMNPSKYIETINNTFNNVFDKQELLLNFLEAPNDVPLVKYSSSNGVYGYDFSKTRINFFLRFGKTDSFSVLKDYLNTIYEFIQKTVKPASEVSRIGIALTYYIEKNNKNHSYWIEKYKMPFKSSETKQMTYTINNLFSCCDMSFNNIIILNSGKIDNKNYPIITIDVNNIPVTMMSTVQMEYILKKMDIYTPEKVLELLNKNGE